MSRSDDGSGGCFAQLLALGILFIIGLCVDLYNNSQYGMMRDARDNTSCDRYFSYLDKYPNGRYAKEAKDSIVSISSRYFDVGSIYCNIDKLSEDPICERLADLAYKHALSSNTLDAWKQYIDGVQTKYYRDALSKIDSIETVIAKREAQSWGTDKLAWKTASKNDTYEFYLKYIKLYPNGIHKSKANKKIIDFEVARDFAGEHGFMPAMDKTGYRSGHISTVTVTNQTSYEMTLLYSGDKDSKRLVISCGGTKSVKLPNGSYRISARVNASNVIPYVGNETLTGGDYSASYYISSTRY